MRQININFTYRLVRRDIFKLLHMLQKTPLIDICNIVTTKNTFFENFCQYIRCHGVATICPIWKSRFFCNQTSSINVWVGGL